MKGVHYKHELLFVKERCIIIAVLIAIVKKVERLQGLYSWFWTCWSNFFLKKKQEARKTEHLWVSERRSMYFWAWACFFYLPGKESRDDLSIHLLCSQLPLIPRPSSGELISCLTHALRQTGRQTEGRETAGKMMGAGEEAEMDKGWHESNWKHILSTCPIWAFYLWKEARRGGGGLWPPWFKGLTQFSDETVANSSPAEPSAAAPEGLKCGA